MRGYSAFLLPENKHHCSKYLVRNLSLRRRYWTEKSHRHHMQTAPKDKHSQGSAGGEPGQRETQHSTKSFTARADPSSPRPGGEASAAEREENGGANLFLANYTHLSAGSSSLPRGIQVVLTICLILPQKSLHNTTGHFSHVNVYLLFFFSFAASYWRKPLCLCLFQTVKILSSLPKL